MAISLCEVSISGSPLSQPEPGWDASSGAMVDFWGVVRGEENGAAIEGLDYEANHAMAEHQLNLIAQSAAKDFGLTQVILRHRIGFVRAGEPSLFLRVAAPRRNKAFAAVFPSGTPRAYSPSITALPTRRNRGWNGRGTPRRGDRSAGDSSESPAVSARPVTPIAAPPTGSATGTTRRPCGTAATAWPGPSAASRPAASGA